MPTPEYQTLQDAYLSWRELQSSVDSGNASRQAMDLRNYRWDVYCALRDGRPREFYVQRRKREDASPQLGLPGMDRTQPAPNEVVQ